MTTRVLKQGTARLNQPATRPAPPRFKKLDVQAEFDRITGLYPDQSDKKVNFLILGPHGTGKTFGLQHCPGPILIHSFDVGGTDCLKTSGQIRTKHNPKGRIIVDTRFEEDSAVEPKAFRLWETEFTRLRNGKVFESIGTYVIDSFTQYTNAMMNAILKGKGRTPTRIADFGKDPDIVPEIGDYNLHQKTITQNLADISSLPCHCVIVGHLNIELDELTKKIFSAVMMDGKKFAQKVPTLFNEVYYADLVGPNYVYELTPAGYKKARSRIRGDGSNGIQKREPQDINAILRKAGYTTKDKEIENPITE